MAAETVLAGWASADITPGLPCRLAGYADRAEPARGVHDPLFAEALALGTPEQLVVVVVCDVVAVDSTVVAEIRRRVSVTSPRATVWIGATHTHSGPELHGNQVTERIVNGASRAAEQAIGAMQPVVAGWASGRVTGVAGNRDHPDRLVNLTLDLVTLTLADTPHAAPAAVFGTFACHPTVLGADNLYVSADLTGAIRRQLRTYLAPPAWVSLATGAAGDISTRHVRREQTFEEVERLAAVAVERAVTILGCRRPIRLGRPVISQRVVRPDTKRLEASVGLEQARLELLRQRDVLLRAGNARQARTCETALQGLALSGAPNSPVQAELSVAGLGDLTLIAVPGELYHELGTTITYRSGPKLLLGYTNGYIGYIPTRAAYADAWIMKFLPAIWRQERASDWLPLRAGSWTRHGG